MTTPSDNSIVYFPGYDKERGNRNSVLYKVYGDKCTTYDPTKSISSQNFENKEATVAIVHSYGYFAYAVLSKLGYFENVKTLVVLDGYIPPHGSMFGLNMTVGVPLPQSAVFFFPTVGDRSEYTLERVLEENYSEMTNYKIVRGVNYGHNILFGEVDVEKAKELIEALLKHATYKPRVEDAMVFPSCQIKPRLNRELQQFVDSALLSAKDQSTAVLIAKDFHPIEANMIVNRDLQQMVDSALLSAKDQSTAVLIGKDFHPAEANMIVQEMVKHHWVNIGVSKTPYTHTLTFMKLKPDAVHAWNTRASKEARMPPGRLAMLHGRVMDLGSEQVIIQSDDLTTAEEEWLVQYMSEYDYQFVGEDTLTGRMIFKKHPTAVLKALLSTGTAYEVTTHSVKVDSEAMLGSLMSAVKEQQEE
jgi:hypothetical protein